MRPLSSLLETHGPDTPFAPGSLTPEQVAAVVAAATTLPPGIDTVAAIGVADTEPGRTALLDKLRDAGAEVATVAAVARASALLAVTSTDGSDGAAAAWIATAQALLAAREQGLAAGVAAVPPDRRPPVPAEIAALAGRPLVAVIGLGPCAPDRDPPPRPREAERGGHADILMSLLEITAAAAVAEDIDRLLETIARELGHLFPVDRADVAFVEGGALQAFIVHPREAMPGKSAARLRLDPEHHFGYVATRGRPLWRNDIGMELRFRESLPRGGMLSDMTIPLKSHGPVIGVFRVASRRRFAFEPEEFEVLKRLANLMAVAVENQRLLQATRRMAEVDGLTGACNQRHFRTLLARETERARSTGQPLALLMADVDHFKRVNDAHGHPAGDAVLRHVAATLTRRLRRSDVLARYGGEEFAVILPGSDGRAAAAVGEQLRAEIERSPAPLPSTGGTLGVTVSIGVAALPDDAGDENGLVEAADRALYGAKREGRNRVLRAGMSGSPDGRP